MIKKYTREVIFRDLESLGLERGDIILLKIDPISLGVVDNNPKTGFLNTLLDFLGKEGTLVVPSFTKSHFLPFINKRNKIFRVTDAPNTGAFSKSLIKHPDSVRSTHPTNSFVGIGKQANNILKDHDYLTHSYFPLKKMMDLDAKGLMIGCLDSSPGHLTAHLAQYDLGQSTRNIFRGLIGATFYEEGNLKTFYRKDVGGHAFGAYKSYAHYNKNKIIKYGMIGNAASGISSMKDSYKIERELLENDPKFLLCDDPMCFSCNATWWYNKSAIPGYLIRKSIYEFKKIFHK